MLATALAALGVSVGRWLSEPLGRELDLGRVELPAARPRLAPLVGVARAAGSSAASAPVAPSSPLVGELPRAEIPPRAPHAWRSTLIVGLDRRPDAAGAGLADSILVAALDEASGHAGVISVPRDLWVAIPEHGDDRINVVPLVAKRQKQDPIELFSRVIEDTLGLPIAHGVVVDLGLFERVVDRVGGVEVQVRCPIVDSFHDARVPGGRRKLELDAGRATLDGATAAMYVRSRHGRSDFGRSRNQQAVLLGLRDRLLAGGGFLLVPELWAEVERSVHTDMMRYELFDLARRALGLDRERLHGLVLAPPLTRAHRTDDGKSVLLLDDEAAFQGIARLFDAAPPGEPIKAPCPPADAALRGR